MKKISQWFQKKIKIENINLLHTWYICFIVIGILFIGLCVRNTVSSPGDMYSFSGAVIGGGLTLIGVMITINHQEENRKEDLAIQFKPIIMYKKISCIDSSGYLSWVFILRNAGSFEAQRITIDCTTKTTDNPKIHSIGTVNILPKGEEIEIEAKFEKNKLELNQEDTLYFSISYDGLKKTRYSTIVEYSYKEPIFKLESTDYIQLLKIVK